MPIVSVSVDPSSGDITCYPDPVTVTAADSLLTFNLLTPGYAFPLADAVTVSGGGAGTDFPYDAWTVQSSLSAVLDLCSVKANHKYSVTVLEAATGKVLTKDPTIINQP